MHILVPTRGSGACIPLAEKVTRDWPAGPGYGKLRIYTYSLPSKKLYTMGYSGTKASTSTTTMDSDSIRVTRRKFLGRVIAAITSVTAAAMAFPLIGYFLSPAWRKAAVQFTPVANVSDIPVGQPTFVTYEERAVDGWYTSTLSKGVWIVNKDGKDFSVFDPRCTHLNCPYYWDKEHNRFQCPCHSGQFDINGNVIGGPPPHPLDRLSYRIEGGTILVGSI